MNNEKQIHCGIVTYPFPEEAGNIPLSQLASILCCISPELYIITGTKARVVPCINGEEVHVFHLPHKSGTNLIMRAVKDIYMQLRISFRLAKLSKRVDQWIFFMGGEELLLPMLAAKLLGKSVVLAQSGSQMQTAELRKDRLSKVLGALSGINFTLSDKIILYSEHLIDEWKLQEYRSKIFVSPRHILDLDRFKMQIPLSGRNDLVGWIGRFGTEKGLLEFAEAIPEILERTEGIKFLVAGDGQLRGRIEEYLDKQNLKDKVRLTGWIPHDHVSDYLNDLKLLVLPSYTEGLPNIVLEAMACGTPVLATPVGAIPDVIRDRETGFIMENNSPECIAQNVVRALNHSNLEHIAKNARAFVENEYTHEKAVERYRKVLRSVANG